MQPFLNSNNDKDALAKIALNMNTTLARAISWLVLVPSIISLFIFFPEWAHYSIALVLVALFYEWIRLFTKRSILITSLCCLLPFLGILFEVLSFMQAAVAWAAINVMIISVRRHFNTSFRVFLFLFGQTYIGLAALATANMYEPLLLLYMILIVVFTDTGAFIGGKLIGGPKLAPAISPNKTWSGFVCGLAACLLGILISSHFIDVPHLFLSISTICILSVFAQLGDLLESACKRYFNIKDTGSIIPGHGGVIDRLDSFLAVSFVVYIIKFFSS